MRVLDIATLAQWVEATPVNDSAQVGPDIVIDTRKVTPGALFIALPGTRVDGHDFTQAAPVSYTHLTLPTIYSV